MSTKKKGSGSRRSGRPDADVPPIKRKAKALPAFEGEIPDHDDYWLLETTAVPMENAVLYGGMDPLEETAKWVDVTSLTHFGFKRAFKILGVTTEEQLHALEGHAAWMATLYLEAFTVGALIAQDRLTGHEYMPGEERLGPDEVLDYARRTGTLPPAPRAADPDPVESEPEPEAAPRRAKLGRYA